MTTVINNPGDSSGEGLGMGMIIGILVVIALVVFFFIYGLPRLRGDQPDQNSGGSININLPSTGNGSGGSTAPSGGTGY